MLFLLYMNYVYISKDLGRNWQEPRTDIFRAIRIIFYLGYYLSMLWWPSFCGPSWTICRLETYQLHLVVLFIYCSSQGPIGNSFGIVAFFKDWVGSFQTELLEPMPFSSWIKLSILAPPEGSAKWAPRQPGLTWPFAFVYVYGALAGEPAGDSASFNVGKLWSFPERDLFQVFWIYSIPGLGLGCRW